MIFDKLVEIMQQLFAIQQQDVSMETYFKNDLAIDSLDLYDLDMALEEEFNIDIPDDKMEGIETVEDLIRLLKELGVED